MASLKKSVRLDKSFKHLMAITFWDFLSWPSSTPEKTSPKFPDPEMNKNHVQKSDKMKKELCINYTTNKIPLQNLCYINMW